MIKIPKHILDLTPYKSGKPIEELAREKRLSKIVKLASNENPLGPSPKAVEQIKKTLTELHRYPDPSSYSLVHALAKKYKRNPEQIFTASGSDAILQYIITTFSGNGDELLSSEGSFIGWYVNVNKLNRKSIIVPLKDYRYNLDGILENINDKTKIIYLANPNNPTGTIFTKKEFDNFISKVPDSILIILDEAYTIYVESFSEYPNGLEYNLDNLIVLGTLSKAYGLAGLRIGFAIANPEIIRALFKVKLPFEPSVLAQSAAIAAMDDDEFIERTSKLNRESLKIMDRKFSELGINHVPTFANFYLLLFSNEKFTTEFNNECLNRGLILRHTKSFGIPNGIRINSGTMEETNFALEIIEDVYLNLLKKSAEVKQK
jgi:histidinol-phosphate aminotransferase